MVYMLINFHISSTTGWLKLPMAHGHLRDDNKLYSAVRVQVFTTVAPQIQLHYTLNEHGC